MTWLRSTVVLVVLGLAAAQMPGFGPCPQFVAKNNFNMKQFMGMWYEVERMFQVLEVASRCIAANYTESHDGKIHVHNFVTSRLTNIQRILDGEVQLTGKDGEGKVVVKYNVIPVTTYDTEFTVLDTDYKNYAVLYHCSSPLPFFNAQNAWIMTRQRYPPPAVQQAAYGVLDKYGINRSQFSKTLQDDCDGPSAVSSQAPTYAPSTAAPPPAAPAAAPAAPAAPAPPAPAAPAPAPAPVSENTA